MKHSRLSEFVAFFTCPKKHLAEKFTEFAWLVKKNKIKSNEVEGFDLT